MAQIIINEISKTYGYNVSTSNYATVAMPITASWGPGYVDPATLGQTQADVLENVQWLHFPATQVGLENFVAAYRGAASNYRITKDYSYQMAMTLLTAGYDVLTCRVSPGSMAEGEFTVAPSERSATAAKLHVKAKYPGTFGNTLQAVLQHITTRPYWNMIIYTVDPNTGVRVALENVTFVFSEEHMTDTIPFIDDVESNFVTLLTENITIDSDDSNENIAFTEDAVMLSGGADELNLGSSETIQQYKTSALINAKSRYQISDNDYTSCPYVQAINDLPDTLEQAKIRAIANREWIFTNVIAVYDLLKDKLSYAPNRVISPGWDDQDFNYIDATPPNHWSNISPLHKKLMDVAYYSRCATGYLDIPKSLQRANVYNTNINTPGYAQLLSEYTPINTLYDLNASLYNTHYALFAPWGQYRYVGTGKQFEASPSFMALMLQRAMILNQSLQYEWALPTNRKHNLQLGKLQYNVPKNLLDEWQSIEGVSLNVITPIPDLGTSLWGNSTMYNVPPASYQALANLSTRLLVNAIEDVVYRVGVAITFTYNNQDAYGAFYAGVTPILDTMRNVGAIDDYLVKMSADINGLDHVNANTVVGKIWITVNGVVNDIVVDLIALPPNVDLKAFAE